MEPRLEHAHLPPRRAMQRRPVDAACRNSEIRCARRATDPTTATTIHAAAYANPMTGDATA
jgi:hypothetical protein